MLSAWNLNAVKRGDIKQNTTNKTTGVIMFLYNDKPQTEKDKLLYEIEQMIYYSNNSLIINKLKIVKDRINKIISN